MRAKEEILTKIPAVTLVESPLKRLSASDFELKINEAINELNPPNLGQTNTSNTTNNTPKISDEKGQNSTNKKFSLSPTGNSKIKEDAMSSDSDTEREVKKTATGRIENVKYSIQTVKKYILNGKETAKVGVWSIGLGYGLTHFAKQSAPGNTLASNGILFTIGCLPAIMIGKFAMKKLINSYNDFLSNIPQLWYDDIKQKTPELSLVFEEVKERQKVNNNNVGMINKNKASLISLESIIALTTWSIGLFLGIFKTKW